MDDRSAFPQAGGSNPGDAPDGLPSERDVLGRAAGENFPVALRLLPALLRRDLLAIYGFARLTDQLGDAYTGDRLMALDWLESDVRRALKGDGGHSLVVPVAQVVESHHLDPQPLFDLIEANRQDQTVGRYASFDDLLAYCQLSANPVGRLVLGVFDQTSAAQLRWSDAICTGLQLAEHWGDVAEDATAGRVYLPSEDLALFGVSPDELLARGRARPALRALLAFESDRARRWLNQGLPLVGALSGWARVAVSGFAGGGYAALDALAAADFDPLRAGARHRRPWRLALTSLGLWVGRTPGGNP